MQGVNDFRLAVDDIAQADPIFDAENLVDRRSEWRASTSATRFRDRAVEIARLLAKTLVPRDSVGEEIRIVLSEPGDSTFSKRPRKAR